MESLVPEGVWVHGAGPVRDRDELWYGGLCGSVLKGRTAPTLTRRLSKVAPLLRPDYLPLSRAPYLAETSSVAMRRSGVTSQFILTCLL